TPLAPEVRPDLHLAVAGDEDLFNKSLLLNEAARHSTAASAWRSASTRIEATQDSASVKSP
ncbi:MAG: hypothetical protein LPK38_06470, partial [Actinomycetes bacterium]|nr:hypothetical protein [Actinomycetes bacterium]MDX5380925.1 hypothetical protein [Actinomycetes bacterium]MDX5400027.1 hypothetical protein [Actinomycetes bacterium]MDX5450685.1 hypothetical protein [Actinomycetes bacterium]